MLTVIPIIVALSLLAIIQLVRAAGGHTGRVPLAVLHILVCIMPPLAPPDRLLLVYLLQIALQCAPLAPFVLRVVRIVVVRVRVRLVLLVPALARPGTLPAQ